MVESPLSSSLGVPVVDTDEMVGYSRDWLRKYGLGHTSPSLPNLLLARPSTYDELWSIVAAAIDAKVPICTQSGNTGLVGGSVPTEEEQLEDGQAGQGQVLLSLRRLPQTVSIDNASGIATCSASVVLQTLMDRAGEQGWTVPLDLGAKGSCLVGGVVATNAGGLRFVRYGSLRGSVLGLSAITAQGGKATELDLRRCIRKDNTGFDLKQLFIGSEGTLGVITEVNLQLVRTSASVQAAFLGVSSFDAVLRVLDAARVQLGEIVSAIEFADAPSVDMAVDHVSTVRNPLQGTSAPFYMLIETQGSSEEHDTAKLSAFLEHILGDDAFGVVDGTMASSQSQVGAFFELREAIPEAIVRSGACYKYDISLPMSAFYDVVERTRERMPAECATIAYGHIADGNLHLNIRAPEFAPRYLELLEPWIFEYVQSHNGSISAEHGIGIQKAPYLSYAKPPAAIDAMRHIKQLFDPHNLMNPGKVLDL